VNILIPDTIFDDEHVTEYAAAAPCSLEIHRAVEPGDLSPSDWSWAQAIVAHHLMPYGTEIADLAENARILVRVGVGVDNIDLPVWQAKGIPVCNIPDYGMGEVADHALVLMLSLLRGLAAYQDRLTVLADDVYDRLPLPGTMRRAAGLNCLVVGYGSIGQAFAGRAAAMGMNVGIFTRGNKGATPATDAERFATLDDGLAWADVVSLHLPLSADTENLIDADRLATMKPDALLINTARGGLVDTGAVVDALQAGRLGGVGLDVFPAEPLATTDALVAGVQNREDWAQGKVILTPHVGGVSPQALEELRRRSVETARDYLVDGVIRNRVA
jgi:lactate dehydrogenase-like 2-hydroxyacid dehydrogenase